MDYLGKGEVLTNTDLDKFVNIIWEKYAFCVHRKSLRSLSSAHENGGKNKRVAFIILFSICGYLYIQLYVKRMNNHPSNINSNWTYLFWIYLEIIALLK